jgi:hypothetical protein
MLNKNQVRCMVVVALFHFQDFNLIRQIINNSRSHSLNRDQMYHFQSNLNRHCLQEKMIKDKRVSLLKDIMKMNMRVTSQRFSHQEEGKDQGLLC